jgi:hypothetical protein
LADVHQFADVVVMASTRNLLKKASWSESVVNPDLYRYDSAHAFVTNSAIDTTFLALKGSEATAKELSECFVCDEDGKCALFMFYACALMCVARSFLSTDDTNTLGSVLNYTKVLTKAIGHAAQPAPTGPLLEFVKAARTAHRVVSRYHSDDDKKALELLAGAVVKVVSRSLAVNVAATGATHGACALFRASRR